MYVEYLRSAPVTSLYNEFIIVYYLDFKIMGPCRVTWELGINLLNCDDDDDDDVRSFPGYPGLIFKK